MKNMILSKADKLILESMKGVMDGMAAYLSDSYELVLHSLEDLNESVIYILNGEHTGRKIGAPITDLALKMFDEISNVHEDYKVYFSKNKKGEPLKSTTIAIRGENDRIIGLLCINMYMNTSFAEIVKSFVPSNALGNDSTEDFSSSSDDLIEASVAEAKQIVMSDESISASNKNKAIIEILIDKGIFRLKDSVVKVEQLMGISKNTIYMHIRNSKKDK
ncbi:MAG: PAS domain-containing protein [Erysipelotrichaceae bacterium]|nr:PAS domain-containing protein [Erysipelotrichaceae bacterium]